MRLINRFTASLTATFLFGQTAIAATVGIDGVTITNVVSQTMANLTLGSGGSPDPVPGFETGSTPAKSEITVPLDPTIGNKFEATSIQSPGGDASVQYDGQWFTYAQENTEYFGFSELSFTVKNENAVPFFGRYRYTIDQAFIDLESSTDNNGDPFKNGSLTPGLGVILRHFVAVDNQIVSDRRFKMWTFYNNSGDDIIVRTEENGLPLVTTKQIQVDPDGSVFTTGWDADLRKPLTASAGLGRFEIGDEKNVVVRMELSAIQATESLIFAKISDPGAIEPRIVEGDITPVPLPASAWMLLVALGSLAALRRRAA